jgi:hypothetical protein
MNESFDSADDSDELDRLLANSSDIDGRQLRESLRGPVTSSFVRRHRRRRIRRAVGMAACYVLGIVTIYAWQQVAASMPNLNPDAIANDPAPASDSKQHSRETLKHNAVTPAIASVDNPAHASAAPIKPSPKKSQFDKLRELGDYHLVERNPEQALRCYRVALRYATDDEFTAASREGSWLLRAICLDSKQEKDHAHEKS